MKWFVAREEETSRDVRGRPLRYLLITMLADVGDDVSVAQLVEWCAARGVTFTGRRGSKVVSDALRWEIAHGHVQRIGRGVYRFRRPARSTMWWIRSNVKRLDRRLVFLLTQEPGLGLDALELWCKPGDGDTRPSLS